MGYPSTCGFASLNILWIFPLCRIFYYKNTYYLILNRFCFTSSSNIFFPSSSIFNVIISSFPFIPLIQFLALAILFLLFHVVKSESANHSVMSSSCNPMDCSPPDSPIYGILQARKLEQIAIPFFTGSLYLNHFLRSAISFYSSSCCITISSFRLCCITFIILLIYSLMKTLVRKPLLPPDLCFFQTGLFTWLLD